MLAFAMIIVFLTFLGLAVKFSRCGRNSLAGVIIHQVGTSETVKGQLQRFDKSSLFDRFGHVENGFDINF